MKNKGEIRVSLGVVISIIIILVLLVVGGYLLYSSNIKISELEEQLSNQKINEEDFKKDVNNAVNDIQSETKEFLAPSIYTGTAKNIETNTTYQLRKSYGNYFYMYIENGKPYIGTNIEEEICRILEMEQIKLKNHQSQEITGFTKNVVDVYMVNMSLNDIPTDFIFLMEDGTLEYSSLRNIATNISTEGKIEGLNNIIKIQDVSVYYADGGDGSAIAIDKDNNYYDLAKYIN